MSSLIERALDRVRAELGDAKRTRFAVPITVHALLTRAEIEMQPSWGAVEALLRARIASALAKAVRDAGQ
jgi:hypothetical protein